MNQEVVKASQGTQSIGPREIKRLDESVVNRIAAGEVIQRPANAVKELLENSLDAGATQVMITVKDGGIKQLQVQDNGCGIEKKDLDLLCERHATSKLREYDDLSSIQTLGFRGEALASISYISHLSVVTMTGDDEVTIGHGWRAAYKDGALQKDSLRPAPGTRGTTILAEDLFYNAPLRRKSLRNASEEYAAVLEVVQRYAVYHAGVAITVKKAGEAKPDLSTLVGASREEAIKIVYGVEVAKHLCPIEIDTLMQELPLLKQGGNSLQCKVQGFVTLAEYTAGRKIKFILFINGRSVDFLPLKRSLEALYANLLPKSSKPFIFLDITLPPSHVDVNIHPTKKEVAFLHQEELVGAISEAVQNVLVSSDTQRTYKQAILPLEAFDMPDPVQRIDRPAPRTETPLQTTPANNDATERSQSKRPEKMVRTDARAQTMHVYQKPFLLSKDVFHHPPFQRRKRGADISNDFLPTAMEISTLVSGERFAMENDGGSIPDQQQGGLVPAALFIDQGGEMQDQNPGTTETTGQATIGKSQQGENANILKHLVAECESVTHEGLMDVFRSQKFVGMVDSCRSLIQAGTRLYLLDLSTLTKDMFYQQALRFCNSLRIAAESVALTPPPSIKRLTLVALEAEEAAGRWEDSEEGGTKEEVADLLSQLLVQKSRLLQELFGIQVSPDGNLLALPRLIDHYVPNPIALPSFVLGLGQRVDWGETVQCASDVAVLLAELYRLHPDNGLYEDLKALPTESEDSGVKERQKQLEWEVEHVLLPALRLFLKPPKERASDGSVVELTCLERLYRVFERC